MMGEKRKKKATCVVIIFTLIVVTQCIAFKSSFHSPINGGDAWNADEKYTNWGWFLARTDNGKWKLMTWGY